MFTTRADIKGQSIVLHVAGCENIIIKYNKKNINDPRLI